MSHLHDEIHEQPQALERLLQAEANNIQQIAQTIHNFDPQFVVIAARGTSDNAARYAKYALGIRLAMPVVLATPSVHTLYESAPNMARALVIGISQSGQSADVRRVLSDAQEQGALTISITNDAQSPLAQSTTYHIDLNAGLERSVAATKTYTTELVAIAMLVEALSGESFDSLQQIPNYLTATLEQCEAMTSWIQRYRYIDRLAVIGRGYNYCTAFEISLKIKELCYIVSEEYSEADFRHGPIAIISDGFPVVVVAPSGKVTPQLRDLTEKLQEKHAEQIIISDDEDLCTMGNFAVQLPSGIPEWLSPICAVVPGQYFAYRLAEARGYNVDEPRSLKKVTSTR